MTVLRLSFLVFCFPLKENGELTDKGPLFYYEAELYTARNDIDELICPSALYRLQTVPFGRIENNLA